MKENHIKDVIGFLREVKEHQDRAKKKSDMESNKFEAVNDAAGIEEDIIVPVSMKPLMNKVINFDLFLDLLTEKLDEQRTALAQKQFE